MHEGCYSRRMLVMFLRRGESHSDLDCSQSPQKELAAFPGDIAQVRETDRYKERDKGIHTFKDIERHRNIIDR